MCKEMKNVTFSNKQIDQKVKSVHVFCTNKERGCDWQGELNDIKSYLGGSNSCFFGEVKCPNECGKMLSSESVTSHAEAECPRRKVDCQYCKDSSLLPVLNIQITVPGYHYIVLTNVKLQVSLVKRWKHTGRIVLWRLSGVSIMM